MKKLLLIIFFIGVISNLHATTIVKAEYFWDIDPGINNGIQLNIFFPLDSLTFTTSIPTSNLTVGNHLLYIRTKSNDGKWSLSEGRSYYVKPVLSSGEYFWDIDPGFNNAQSFIISPQQDSSSIIKNISTSGLTAGNHILYFRTKSNNGKWSLTEGRTYYIKPILTSGEYFWDTDPGFNNAQSFTISIQQDSTTIIKSISTTGLSVGYHNLYIRTKSSNGQWSLSEARPYLVKAQIDSAEYFWDNDPGINNAITFPAFNVSDSINVIRNIPTTGLKSGYHIFYIRTKTTGGTWSLSEGRSIYVQPQIVQAEYFWDTDPGINNATKTSTFSGSDSININPIITTSGLAKGYHTLYIRTKNTDNIWSLSEGRNLYIQPKITAAEYFWDTDPGLNNGISISSFAISDSVNFNPSISTLGLRTGYHTFYTRTKDTDGIWSISEGRTIYVSPLILGGETFWDHDPGIGQGSPIFTLIPNDTISGNITFSSVGLSRGMHNLYIRYKNTDQTWGLTEGRSINFYVPIVAAEYYYDNDPGQGNGNSIIITTGDTINFNGGIILPSLTSGFHKIFIRTMDSEGVWSFAESRQFNIPIPPTIVATKIISAEYFYDNDPGIGNATVIAVPQTSTVNFNGGISIPTLAEGFHQLNIRTQDDLGKWSLSERRTFYINNITTNPTSITDAEFFIDADPGIGNGTTITIDNPASTINQCANISLPSMSTGSHQLFVRTKDNNNRWSLQEPRAFTGFNTSNVTISPASPVYVCNSGSVQLIATLTGGFSVSQWYKECNLLNGATGNSITVNTSGTYMVVISNGSQIQTAFVKVIVVPRLTAYIVAGGGGYCSNPGIGAAVQLSNSTASINYSLRYNGNSVQTIFAVGGLPLTFNNQTQVGNYTVLATDPISGCTATMLGSANIFLTTASYWYRDYDTDGYGNNSIDSLSCSQPSGYVPDNTDCDDTNPLVYPGRVEICNNAIDDNCDLQIDEGCTTGITFNLKVFIQGFYDSSSHLMTSVLSNAGITINSFECDTINVEFYDPLNLSAPFMSKTAMLYIDGTSSIELPLTVFGNSYYIVVKHRNSMETWSKNPVLFTGNPITFDFTTP